MKTLGLLLLGYGEVAGNQHSQGSHPKLVADLGSQPGMPPNKAPDWSYQCGSVDTGGL